MRETSTFAYAPRRGPSVHVKKEDVPMKDFTAQLSANRPDFAARKSELATFFCKVKAKPQGRLDPKKSLVAGATCKRGYPWGIQAVTLISVCFVGKKTTKTD